MPTYERFKQALVNIDGAQWRSFERLATVFLAEEYPSLRPMAAASGDDGMDAVLFQPVDDLAVALQFSVRQDWDAKIFETCTRLAKTAPGVKMLVFASNQEAGPRTTAVRKSVRSRYGLFLDVRDREWFLTQRNHSAAVQAEAEEFSTLIASPLSSGQTSLERQAQALDDLEAKAAFANIQLGHVGDLVGDMA